MPTPQYKSRLNLIPPSYYTTQQVRLFLRRGLSVRYLLPAPVVDYIEQNGLYLEEGTGSGSGSSLAAAEKDKEPIASGSKKDSHAQLHS
jgi:nicotinamide mononucleotide adenylyltransferase